MAQHIVSIQQASLQSVWLTIGTYDGVHIGHQEIVRGLAEGAHRANVLAVVVTFHPHPAAVIRKQEEPHLLTMPDERVEYLTQAGADIVITHPFDQKLAGTTALEFLKLLKQHLGFDHLWVGYDFALGHKREGNIHRLQELGPSLNYELKVIPPVQVNGQVISSSRIRGFLREGRVAEAAQGLGRWYKITGEVVRGDGRGRSLGIPTANLMLPPEKFIPETGVYACIARLGKVSYPAAVNIGMRPTFDGATASTQVEAHLLDFRSDLYGQQLSIYFVERLRGEKRFANIHNLVEQVQKDIERTREIVNIPLLTTW